MILILGVWGVVTSVLFGIGWWWAAIWIIPGFILVMNLVGFATLPIYGLIGAASPEAKALRTIESGALPTDVWRELSANPRREAVKRVLLSRGMSPDEANFLAVAFVDQDLSLAEIEVEMTERERVGEEIRRSDAPAEEWLSRSTEILFSPTPLFVKRAGDLESDERTSSHAIPPETSSSKVGAGQVSMSGETRSRPGRYCQECGAAHPNDHVFCMNCGARLE